MADRQQLQESINKIEDLLMQIKSEFNKLNGEGAAPTPPASPEGSFEQLKELLLSDKWPVAANKNLICDPDNDADKVERGRGVVELMVETDLAGKKFLDFGCGEGHSAFYAATRDVALSVGYDVVANHWESRTHEKLVLTTDWATVVSHAPYDAILLFDVIDHLVTETPVQVIAKVKEVLSPTGRVYVRTHPITSRHALHNYHDLNKGYMQLVFSVEELKLLLPDAKHVEWHQAGVCTPLATYKGLFDEAQLEIVNTRPVKDTVEAFFKAPSIAERIQKRVNMPAFPEFQMGMQFIDYVLKKPDPPILAVNG